MFDLDRLFQGQAVGIHVGTIKTVVLLRSKENRYFIAVNEKTNRESKSLEDDWRLFQEEKEVADGDFVTFVRGLYWPHRKEITDKTPRHDAAWVLCQIAMAK